jgi:hypothetical protein
MSDQEEARIAASRHFDDLYSRWLVRPSPGNRFLNDRYGSIPDVRDEHLDFRGLAPARARRRSDCQRRTGCSFACDDQIVLLRSSGLTLAWRRNVPAG